MGAVSKRYLGEPTPAILALLVGAIIVLGIASYYGTFGGEPSAPPHVRTTPLPQ